MNNAGLPGTGLGGLFYIALALWMPVAELYQTLRGRSSLARWRLVGTQFAIACGIVGMTVATAAGYVKLAGAPSPLGLNGPALVFAPVLLAAALLICLVAVLRIWARMQGPRPVEAPVPSRRVLVGAGHAPGRHRQTDC